MRKVTLIFLVLILSSVILPAQKTRRVTGEYTYILPASESLMEGRIKAEEKAKLDALVEAFGTTVSQNNFTQIQSSNSGGSSVDFYSLSGTEVNGEWIETTKGPDFQTLLEGDALAIKVKISGIVREKTRHETEFNAKLLANGIDERFETSEFFPGDTLYLSFRSPADGHLAVYWVDDKLNAFCLLPYKSQDGISIPVQRKTDYIFFSPEHSKKPYEVDTYVLTLDGEIEHNQIYIIYSPNSFVTADDKDYSELVPKTLSFYDFQRWLGKNRLRDDKMQVETRFVTIKKK